MHAHARSVEIPDTTLMRELPDGQGVVLDLKSEKYFALNETATIMWRALAESESIDEAFERLSEELDEPGDLLADLNDLIGHLKSKGLIRIRSG